MLLTISSISFCEKDPETIISPLLICVIIRAERMIFPSKIMAIFRPMLFAVMSVKILAPSGVKFIIISCVMVSGETLSMNKAARTLTRFFYKHYDGAYSDFKIYSEDICFADVDYFDPVLSKIVKGKFMVLSMFPEKGYFLKCSSSGEPDFSSHNRLIISKEEVSKIERTE